MIRNIKVLGVALAAVFAMSAMASAAQASEVTVAESPATLDGSQSTTHLFESPAGTITCATANFNSVAGHTVSNGDEEVTITPEYSGCHITKLGGLITLDVTVTHEGCYYRFTLNPPPIVTDIVCPTNPITVHIYNGKNVAHTAANSLCTLTIGGQTIEEGVTTENMTGSSPDDVTLNAEVEVAYTSDVGAAGSRELCGPEHETALYTGNTTVRATNGNGEFINGTITN